MTPSAPARCIAAFGQQIAHSLLLTARTARAAPSARQADVVELLGRVALSALPLVVVAAFFVGLVTALQTVVQLERLGTTHLVADIVAGSDVDRSVVAPRVLACAAGGVLLTWASVLASLAGGFILDDISRIATRLADLVDGARLGDPSLERILPSVEEVAERIRSLARIPPD